MDKGLIKTGRARCQNRSTKASTPAIGRLKCLRRRLRAVCQGQPSKLIASFLLAQAGVGGALAQPTILREYRSSAAARYSQPPAELRPRERKTPTAWIYCRRGGIRGARH